MHASDPDLRERVNEVLRIYVQTLTLLQRRFLMGKPHEIYILKKLAIRIQLLC